MYVFFYKEMQRLLFKNKLGRMEKKHQPEASFTRKLNKKTPDMTANLL